MWLVKTEPTEFSYDQLAQTAAAAVWDGVRNPAALKNLGAMAVGERVFVYHTGSEKAVVGEAKVARAAYPDPKTGNSRLVVVDLKPVRKLARPVALAQIKGRSEFAASPLVRQGRLSVVPLTAAQVKVIEDLGR